MSEWINARERLPDNKQNVLVVIDGIVCMAVYNKTYGFPSAYSGNQEPVGSDVTHWMPLPEPPGE